MYAVLNVSNDIYNEAYRLPSNHSCQYVGQRFVPVLFVFFYCVALSPSLHNHWNERDSLDFNVCDAPKRLNTTCQSQEQMRQITGEHQIGSNGGIGKKKEEPKDKQLIRKRISELESELNYLRTQL